MSFRYLEPRGTLMISVPHAGLALGELSGNTGKAWSTLPDTDWHVDRLAEEARPAAAGLLVAELSRYVVDLNRPADDAPLYAGAGTGLVPTETFAGEPLYPAGEAPDESECERRRLHWRPFHERLLQSLQAVRARHGFAVLLDMHSIASRVPRLFDGHLPDLNLGTFDGASCGAEIERAVRHLLEGQNQFSWVINGRFKGGFITRHYGRPEDGIHALQLEISQSCYMDEDDPRAFSQARAKPLIGWLQQLTSQLAGWRPG